MFYLTLIILAVQFQGLNAQADANGVTLAEKVEEVELRLLQPGAIDFGVQPCSNNLFQDPAQGEQTAAQWTRLVFHDFATANVGAGTGGLDGSISFESDREENIGVFVNASIGDFSAHSSIYRSMADVIGMGLAASMASCDSTQPLIKLRAGRIDATGPGPKGVPGPLDTLAFARNAFAAAGFSSSEMIQAVACGHSIGAVHRTNFPDIVGPNADTTGTHGADHFDSTPFSFDNTVVNEYLSNTGRRGGPLVVGPNVAARSDFRIFNSDKNVTMRALAPANTFRSTCFTVFEKMLNTVPSGVVLSDPIVPRQWILREGHLELDNTDTVRYAGVITTHSKKVVAPVQASWFFGTNGGGNTGTQLSDTGAPHNAPPTAFLTAFGQITDFNFNQTLGHTPLDITTFNIAKSTAPTTSVYNKPLNSRIFILVRRSFFDFGTDAAGNPNLTTFVTAAVHSTLASGTITATFYYPVRQQGSLAPRYVRKTVNLTQGVVRGSYRLYSATIVSDLPVQQGGSHVDVQKGSVRSAKVSMFDFARCTNSDKASC